MNQNSVLPLYLGQHERKLDVKGRVSLPVCFRKAAESEGSVEVITFRPPQSAGQLICVDIPGLQILSQRAEALVESVSHALNLYRADKEGRVVLRDEDKKHLFYGAATSTDEKLIFAGRQRFFEIHSEQSWSAHKGTRDAAKAAFANFLNLQAAH